mmetsp:Transcript_34377/g.72419  ORF Transcript_34377/g.72419 Transcript_34377/m.72419 type:complete len:161 (+) Transcript_34377:320-802(+)
MICLSVKVGWPSYLLCIANINNQRRRGNNRDNLNNQRLFPSHSLQQPSTSHYASQQIITHHQHDRACRDLSGHRLRHVNDEIKLRKWREMQSRRGEGEEVDELAALKTPSGSRNWHLMVPTWGEGASLTNKGKRKMERQLAKEVRGWKGKEELAKITTIK